MASQALKFILNGELRQVDAPDPRQTLLDYLRAGDVRLTGAKLCCGEGGCGACTVTLTSLEPGDRAFAFWGGTAGRVGSQKLVERTVNACLLPLCAVHGMAVTTIEGLNPPGELHPVGALLVEKNGSQCGYCTPGWVMSMHALLARDIEPAREVIEDSFDGHICRCTGYRAILDAMQAFARSAASRETLDDLRRNGTGKWSLETLIKPLEPATFASGSDRWQRVLSLSDLATALEESRRHGDHRQVRLVAGNSGAALASDPDPSPRHFIDIAQVDELTAIKERWIDGVIGLQIGAAIPLSRLIAEFERRALALDPANAARLRVLARYLRRAANSQVRNRATLGGHLALYLQHKVRSHPLKSPTPYLSDILPWLVVLDAQIEDGHGRLWPINEFLARLPEDDDPLAALTVAVWLPDAKGREIFGVDRLARRPQNAKPLISGAWRIHLDPAGREVEELRVAYCGLGVGPLQVRLADMDLEPFSLANLVECGPDDGILFEIADRMVQRFPELSRMSGNEASARERLDMARDLFARFVMQGFNGGPGLRRGVSKGRVLMPVDPDHRPIGEPLPKQKADLQVSGRALYTADLSGPLGTRVAVFVTSTHRHARITFDHERCAALLQDGAIAGHNVFVLTAKDFDPASKNAYRKDEKLLASDKVSCFGQPIALVVAPDLRRSRLAAKLISEQCVSYEPLSLAISTIEMAKEAGERGLLVGEPMIVARKPAMHVAAGRRVTGTMETGEQAHFYMEPQAVLAVPDDDGGITIAVSSQHLASVQENVAQVLGLRQHKVRVKVVRLGGGFGGKETRTQPLAAVVALAAMTCGTPVRLVLERDADTTIIGYRHPFAGHYDVGFDDTGRIHRMDLTFRSDGGHSVDVSKHVMELAVLSADGSYEIDNFKVTGWCHKTNTMSRTAIRTFGVTQCSLILETAIEHVAHALNRPAEEIREVNFYPDHGSGKTSVTPYGQPLDHCIINDVWQQLRKAARFDDRVREVAAFNRANTWRKRGIVMIPIKYGVAYTFLPYNQGSAYVAIHEGDGSICLHTGAIEMGQGVHTKLCQIAAESLGVAPDLIEIAENTTDVIANASSSGASTGADLNGGAIKIACDALRERLSAMLERLQRDHHLAKADDWISQGLWRSHAGWMEHWPKIIAKAYGERLNLAEQAHYQSPRLTGFDPATGTGTPFLYFTYSAACSEVEIDVLTGEFNVIRSDILYDAGRSLNPLIDIGQIQGGFVQGLGNVTTEQIYYDDQGAPLSSNFWNYKPPCSKTIPMEFNTRIYQYDVTALEEDPHLPFAIGRSKSTGEPPAVLANSVFFAIRQAVAAARAERGWRDWFPFHAPATILRIRRACRERHGVGDGWQAEPSGGDRQVDGRHGGFATTAAE